jgi:hypothetical protein
MIGMTGCSCPDTPDYFDITGLGLTIYKYDQQTSRYIAMEEDLPLVMNNFYLRADFTLRYYGLNEYTTNPYAAYALTCEDRGERGTDEKIESFHIIALTDFDAQHLQGDTLDDLFSVGVYSRGQKMQLSQLVADTNRIYYRELYLDLQQKPTRVPIQFRIDLQLNTGEKYSVTSKPITIQ